MQYIEKLNAQTCTCTHSEHCPGHANGCSVHCHALHWCFGDDSFKEELEHLKQAFKNNWMSSCVIQQALHTKDKRQTTAKETAGVALLPYHHFIFNKTCRLLAKHNVTTIHIPVKKAINTLRLIKDNLCLRTSGMYCIQCKCGEVYRGQASTMIEIRCQKPRRHLWHGKSEKSALAEQINTRHEFQLEITYRLDRTTTYMDHLVREAVEMELYLKNCKGGLLHVKPNMVAYNQCT